MKRADIDRFEKLVGQLQAMYDELSLLSKKSPNDAVNKFKLSFINKTLVAAIEFLGKGYRPFEDFGGFDEDSLPQNSDVIFVFAQFLQSFEKLRADNVEIGPGGRWYWRMESEGGRPTEPIRTTSPRRLKD